MAEYIVKWTIDLEGKDPLEVAKEALKTLQDPGSIATIFLLKNKETNECFSVDLSEEDENAVLPTKLENFKED